MIECPACGLDDTAPWGPAACRAQHEWNRATWLLSLQERGIAAGFNLARSGPSANAERVLRAIASYPDPMGLDYHDIHVALDPEHHHRGNEDNTVAAMGELHEAGWIEQEPPHSVSWYLCDPAVSWLDARGELICAAARELRARAMDARRELES